MKNTEKEINEFVNISIKEINNFSLQVNDFKALDVRFLLGRAETYNINIEELIHCTQDYCIEAGLPTNDLDIYFYHLYKFRVDQFIEYTNEALRNAEPIKEREKLVKLLAFLEKVEVEESICIEGFRSVFVCDILNELNDKVFNDTDLIALIENGGLKKLK